MMLATCLVACAGNEEAAGSKIAVQKGTTSLMYAQVLKGAEAVSYDTFALAANDMKNGNADYVFVDKTTAKALCKEISGLNRKQLTQYRREDVGFVFQFYNLIGNLTALENVELANQICKDPLDAAFVLENVGLRDRMKNFPSQLSGGEQQRVAIARALAKNPKLLLCDEPTGALDYKTGKAILKLLQDTARRTGMTVIIITHNSALTAMADRVIRVNSGTVVSQQVNENPVDVAEIEW
jgi:putative ABC transport system ATP-binding protein